MFVQNVLRDSFKELKIVLKDSKLLFFSSVLMLIYALINKFCIYKRELIILIPSLIINLVFITYQHYRVGKIIQTKEKRIIKDKDVSFGSRLVKLIKSLLVLISLVIGVAVSIVFVFFIISYIISESASSAPPLVNLFVQLSKLVPIIAIIFFLMRGFLCIPLSVLDNTHRPVHLSLELTKGYFWKLFVVILVPLSFVYLNSLISFAKLNFIVNSLVTISISVIANLLTTIIAINSMYYLMNKDAKKNVEEKSSFEAM